MTLEALNTMFLEEKYTYWGEDLTMKDIDIIKQLMAGNHLEPKELKRAQQLVYALQRNIDGRV